MHIRSPKAFEFPSTVVALSTPACSALPVELFCHPGNAPACLALPAPACPALPLLRNIPPTQHTSKGQHIMFGNVHTLAARPRGIIAVRADTGDNNPAQMMERLNQAFAGFKERNDNRLRSLEAALNDIAKQQNRPPIGDSSTASRTEVMSALGAYVRSGDEGPLANVRNAMSTSHDPAGGYTVYPVLSDEWTRRLFDLSPMRRLARIKTITTGDSFEEPIDKGDVGATWAGEKQARTATATPDLGLFEVPVREIYASQPVTQRLLEDSNIDLGSWLDTRISDRFARSEGTAFVIGDGVLQPRGYLTYDAETTADATRDWGKLQYIKTGNAADLPATNPGDKLLDVVYALRAPYKQGGEVVWMMNSTTAGTVRKFKDGQGRYLWGDSIVKGQPPSLLGYPVELDENMPDIGAGTTPIAFGNFRLGYVIVDKAGVKFLRDPFSDKPNVIFYAWRRVGGGLANSEAIKLLKCEA